MPPYRMIDQFYLIFMIGIGLIITLVIILARATPYWTFGLKKESKRDMADNIHEFGGGVTETHRPMTLLLWVVTVGYFIWAVGYVIYISVTGY